MKNKVKQISNENTMINISRNTLTGLASLKYSHGFGSYEEVLQYLLTKEATQ